VIIARPSRFSGVSCTLLRKEVALLPCLVIGDSIAVGVGHYLTECRTEARVGITSEQFVHEMLSQQFADTVVISLGVNDGPSPFTAANLQRVRETVRGRMVYWLLPPNHDFARAVIRSIAIRFGDRLIDCAPEAGPDGLHPTGAGYRTLGTRIRTTG
jgi:lysophospholipase L1-like esterase